MMLSSVTVSLVPEARHGPFVFHDDLAAACATAAELGFDAVEIFAPSGNHVNRKSLQGLLEGHRLRLAAVGTGAGMILHGFSLCDPNESGRERARDYVRRMIDFGALFGAPAIVGSMQGRAGTDETRASAMGRLADSLGSLAAYAAERGQNLLFEPINRYETDLVNSIDQGVRLCQLVEADNLKLLADLFHMNIEEPRIESSIGSSCGWIGHVHFADSNRRAVGYGHTAMRPIMQALKAAGYSGFLSAEVFPHPDSRTCATMTIRSFRNLVSGLSP